MSVILARLKQTGTWMIYVIPFIILAIILIVWKIFKPFIQPVAPTSGHFGSESLNQIIASVSNKIVQANNQATIEVAIARTQDAAIKQQLQETLQIEDESTRLQQLVNLRKKVSR